MGPRHRPGAQIVLVEANSQSLSDLMAGVATAASQPGVSVVSMSWGFAEGPARLRQDEAIYDSYLPRGPGRDLRGQHRRLRRGRSRISRLLAQRGGGRRHQPLPQRGQFLQQRNRLGLLLGRAWGRSSAAAAASAIYEAEPAYQQGVQSTGYRTTPDVSFVADPATGAWIADPYNLPGDNPFEVVGGTSLSAPAWAGLIALANQGRAAAGKPRSEQRQPDRGAAGAVQPAAERLQRDHQRHQRLQRRRRLQPGDRPGHARGRSPGARPGRVPWGRHNLPGATTVGALKDWTLTDTGAITGQTINVFSVFNSFTVTGKGPGKAPIVRAGGNLGSSRFGLPTRGVVNRPELMQRLNTLAAGPLGSIPLTNNAIVNSPDFAAHNPVALGPVEFALSDTMPTALSSSRRIAERLVSTQGISIKASRTSTASLQGSVALRGSMFQASAVDALLSDPSQAQSLLKMVRKLSSAKKITDPTSDTLIA